MENEKTNEVQVSGDTKKKKSKKKWIIIAVIAVLFIAIMGSSGEDSDTTVETPDTNGTTTTQASDLIGDTSKKETTTEEKTTVDETKEIKVGSTVKNDHISIFYKSCNDNFKKYSQYADLKKGYKVIQVVFDFENISEVDQTLNGFTCYADGVKCEEFYFVDDYSSPVLETISAGRKFLDATVYYEVPKDAELIELEYEAGFWSSEKYIFVVD